jgi:urease accessory protein
MKDMLLFHMGSEKEINISFTPEANRRQMTVKRGVDKVSLLQLSDSFFPTGMYTTSNGLEAYFYSKTVKSANELRDLIKVYLEQQIGPADCNALGNAYKYAENSDMQRLIEVDQTMFAVRLIEEVRNASTRSGIQILKCVNAFISTNYILNAYQKAINEGKASGVYPVALAVASYTFGIPKNNAGIMILYNFTVSMVGAALRLGIINHYDGQRIIHELKSIIVETAEDNIDRSLSSIWQFSPGIDINQMTHERMLSRMFIT